MKNLMKKLFNFLMKIGVMKREHGLYFLEKTKETSKRIDDATKTLKRLEFMDAKDFFQLASNKTRENYEVKAKAFVKKRIAEITKDIYNVASNGDYMLHNCKFLLGWEGSIFIDPLARIIVKQISDHFEKKGFMVSDTNNWICWKGKDEIEMAANIVR